MESKRSVDKIKRASKSRPADSSSVASAAHDVARLIPAERERLDKLSFFENMDRVNRAIQGAPDLEQMMKDVMDIMLSIFGCDRAWLLFPCDPETDKWQVPMECTRPQYPGALAQKVEVPITPEIAGLMRILLGSDSPAKFGPGTEYPLAEEDAERFGYKSLITMPIRPKLGKPWAFGMHQCSYARTWTKEEERLFQEIGRRLADGLTGLLAYRDLQKSEGRYSNLFARAGEGICILSLDGTIISVNDSFARMRGYEPSELIGSKQVALDTPETAQLFPDRFRRLLCGESLTFEVENYHKNGRIIPFEVSSSIIMIEGESYVQSFVRDITDRRKSEKALRDTNAELERHRLHLESLVEERTSELSQARDDAEAANIALKTTYNRLVQQDKMASIGQLAAGVAHEINNPMGFISSNLSTLRRYLNNLTAFIDYQEAASRGEAPPEAVAAKRNELKIERINKDALDLIDESLEGAERIKKIVRDLRGFSQIDRADYDITDINQCLESAISIIWNTLKFKVNITREFGELPKVKCWPRQLSQVFMNLLMNAFNAIETFGDIVVKTWSDGESVFIAISDTGCGIPASNLKRIFEPFFTTKTVGEGTGLGLSISYDIIKKHNGELTVESRLGKGSKFLVRLPVL
jgi:PAS domain S-box-containing protein